MFLDHFAVTSSTGPGYLDVAPNQLHVASSRERTQHLAGYLYQLITCDQSSVPKCKLFYTLTLEPISSSPTLHRLAYCVITLANSELYTAFMSYDPFLCCGHPCSKPRLALEDCVLEVVSGGSADWVRLSQHASLPDKAALSSSKPARSGKPGHPFSPLSSAQCPR